MPRAIVYDEPEVTARYRRYLAKYVPAEAITVMSLVFAAWPADGNTVYVALAAAALANAVYLFSIGLGQAKKCALPRLYFYVLSAVALVLWAIATLEPVQNETGIVKGDDRDIEQTAVLAGAAFLIPALDSVLDAMRLRVRFDRK